jgi:hypothetical protein
MDQPYPLRPTALIRLFMGAEGAQLIEANTPSTPPYNAKTLSEIRTYLVRYSIGTVVVDMTAPDPQLVVHYLQGVLGQPEIAGFSDVWFDVQGILADTPVPGSGSSN